MSTQSETNICRGYSIHFVPATTSGFYMNYTNNNNIVLSSTAATKINQKKNRMHKIQSKDEIELNERDGERERVGIAYNNAGKLLIVDVSQKKCNKKTDRTID